MDLLHGLNPQQARTAMREFGQGLGGNDAFVTTDFLLAAAITLIRYQFSVTNDGFCFAMQEISRPPTDPCSMY